MSRRGLAGLVACSLVAAAGVAAGQLPSFRADTRLVVLHATVMNRRGELVTNLDRDAFAVFENGRRQPITVFRRDDVPVSLGLLVDNSGSMRLLRAKAEAAALAFVRASNPDDEIFLLDFADKAHVDVPMTGDIHLVERGLARADAIGGTAMRDAVAAGEAYLRDHARWDRRVLLLITDGNDNSSATTVDQIRAQAEVSETVIDAIGVMNESDAGKAKAGRRALEELTARTGGVSYFPATTDLESIAVRLARTIRNQYTIGYMPLEQTFDGAFRTVRLTVAGPEKYTVQTKTGYRAIANESTARDTRQSEDASLPRR